MEHGVGTFGADADAVQVVEVAFADQGAFRLQSCG
jgi:hypothetical protein